jgi:hypothetical protein
MKWFEREKKILVIQHSNSIIYERNKKMRNSFQCAQIAAATVRQLQDKTSKKLFQV